MAHIQFMQGTGVPVDTKEDASTVEGALEAAHEDDGSDISIIRVTTTPNDDDGYTVAVNTKYAYDDARAASTQKVDFETELRGLDPLIDDGLEAGAADRMTIEE